MEYAIKRFEGTKGAISKKVRDRFRNNTLEVMIEDLPEDLSHTDLLIVDDVIITSTTLRKNIERIKESYSPEKMPRSITCAAAHGEFSYNDKYGKSGLDLLLEEGANVIVTNMLETPVSRVDVSGDVAEAVVGLYEDGFF